MKSVIRPLFLASLILCSPVKAQEDFVLIKKGQNVSCQNKEPKSGSTWTLTVIYKGENYEITASLKNPNGDMHFEAPEKFAEIPQDERSEIISAIIAATDNLYEIAVLNCLDAPQEARGHPLKHYEVG